MSAYDVTFHQEKTELQDLFANTKNVFTGIVVYLLSSEFLFNSGYTLTRNQMSTDPDPWPYFGGPFKFLLICMCLSNLEATSEGT